MNYVEKFNQIFLEFLQDLVYVFPSDTDLRGYLLAIKAGLLLRKEIVCSVFHKHLLIYEDQVLRKDESFFLEKDFSEFHSNKVDVRQLVHKLKGYWDVLTEDNKETLWRYFKVLMALTRHIYPEA